MTRALVTGGGGFLGRYIAEQLREDGWQVRILGRGFYPELVAMGMESVRGDVRDPAAVERACSDVEVVFHTAALAGIWGRWSDYYETNTEGTRNIIASCQKLHVPRLVYTSSPSVTFSGEDQMGVDETAPYPSRWTCHYAHSKALAEQAVLAAHDRRGLATCALRPHLIWGPRDSHLLPRLVDRARRGRLRRVGDGTNQIDIAYVENAARAHVLAAERLSLTSIVGGKAYFISQGVPVNCWQWIDQLLEIGGQPPITKGIPFRNAYRLGALCELVFTLARIRSEPPMTRFLASQLAKSHYFDISAAKRDFGYVSWITTDEGLARLRNWMNADD